MNRPWFIAFFLGLCASLSAQGLVNFQNSPATLISSSSRGFTRPIGGPPGTYYFALLAAPMQASKETDFVFTGLYATNTGTDGRFAGSSAAEVSGISPGQSFKFLIAGWSANDGATFQQDWLRFPPCEGLGISAIGSGIAGGSTTNGTLPALDLFGGPTGLQTGFTITAVLTPPNPTTPPVFFSPKFDAKLGFSVSAQLQTNRTYVLQYSTNLIDWIKLMTYVSCPPILSFNDTNKVAAQFYRIVPFYQVPPTPSIYP